MKKKDEKVKREINKELNRVWEIFKGRDGRRRKRKEERIEEMEKMKGWLFVRSSKKDRIYIERIEDVDKIGIEGNSKWEEWIYDRGKINIEKKIIKRLIKVIENEKKI